ncbi:teichuronic acid biosynthesis glycosyltransferase TuaG [Chitinophaga japonensis]|uniref:Teichuronic acid biosynthesis glycosyltransferase TuaG n=2 Tax=Chitinophaga japonensis TaxID=104662 RepID=A0A562T4C5_CHIJA|nr:teichuronic acid biosynthesis glycosyltransferase TuaG [Chitinophaga japonensis]
MSAPLVSIITPAYNVEKYIDATITSVIKQTYENWELIVVDDHSGDDTFSIVSSYAQQDKRIRIVKTPENGGAAAARNFGIELARGAYIAFLDSDDLWMPDKLEIQIRQMRAKNALFSFTGYQVINECSKYIKTIHVPKKFGYRKLLQGSYIGCLTVIYSAEKLGKMFFPVYDGPEDYILWLRISKMIRAQQIIGINMPLAMYRKRNGSISSDKIKAAVFQWQVYRKVEQLNIMDSLAYFLSYAVKGVIKHYLA